MHLNKKSRGFLVLISIFTLHFQSIYAKNAIFHFNNEKVNSLISTHVDNLSHAITLLVTNITNVIKLDEELNQKFLSLVNLISYDHSSTLASHIEHEMYIKGKDMAKSLTYNKLLHLIRKLKSLYILSDFYKTLSSTKDLKAALNNYHETIFKNKKYFDDLLEKNKEANALETPDTEGKSLSDKIDQNEIDLAIEKDMIPDYNSGNPFDLIEEKPGRYLLELIDKYKKPNTLEKYDLNRSWRIITSLFDEKYMSPNESKYWHSMLSVESYLASNGNPLLLGQFLWFEIVLKNYDRFFVDGNRKLYTWGDILLADDKARFNLLDHLCGTTYTITDAAVPRLAKAMNHKVLVDMHCQALELTIDQINYLEQVYKKHFTNTKNISNIFKNVNPDPNDAELNVTEKIENKSWFFMYPPRLYNTPYSDNLSENSFTPIEPLTITELIETHYRKDKEKVKAKNNPTSFIKVNSLEGYVQVKNLEGRPDSNFNYQFKLDEEKTFEGLLLLDPIKFLYSPDDLTDVLTYDSATFFAGVHNYVKDPIYAIFFQERVPLSFEAWYAADYTNNNDFYKPLVNNTISCMNILLGKNETDHYLNKSDLTIDWKLIPEIFNAFDKSPKYYHFCKDYLTLSMFFMYKSLGYTNLERVKFLFSPKGTYPRGNIFSNTSYLLRDAITIDKSWQVVLLLLRLVTLQKGIADYNSMKHKNLNSINMALDGWERKNAPVTMVNRFNLHYSEYPSIILEKSLSNETLNKILDIDFLMHYDTFLELDRFLYHETGQSLVERMNDFIGIWTKYGYEKTLKEIECDRSEGESNRNCRNYINFTNWNRQVIGMLQSTLNRFLKQPYVQSLIDANKEAPWVYRVPNSIQLALDSSSKLDYMDKDIILLSTIVESPSIQLWYPVKINYTSVIDVINEVRFVCDVMKPAIEADQMENVFTDLISRINFMMDSNTRHTPGVVVSEVTSYVSPYYSNMKDEARHAEMQKSMGAMLLSKMWSFFYKTIIPMIQNRSYLIHEENNFQKLKWEEVLYDPKSVYSLKKFSRMNDGFMVKLKNFFSNHYVYKRKLDKSVLSLSLSYTSTLTGHFYYHLGFKKLGASLIFFSPYYADILSTWKKTEVVKGLNITSLAISNQFRKSDNQAKLEERLEDVTANSNDLEQQNDGVKSLRPIGDLEGPDTNHNTDPYITNKALVSMKDNGLNKANIDAPINTHGFGGGLMARHRRMKAYIAKKFKNVWVRGLIKTAIIFSATLFSISALGFEITLLLFLGASGIRWFGKTIAHKRALAHAREAMPAIK